MATKPSSDALVVALQAEITYLRSQVQQERDRYSALVAATMVRGAVSSGHTPVLAVPSLQPPSRTAEGVILAMPPAPQGAVDLAIDAIAEGAPNPAAVRKSLQVQVARMAARNASETDILAMIEKGAGTSAEDDE